MPDCRLVGFRLCLLGLALLVCSAAALAQEPVRTVVKLGGTAHRGAPAHCARPGGGATRCLSPGSSH